MQKSIVIKGQDKLEVCVVKVWREEVRRGVGKRKAETVTGHSHTLRDLG